MPLVLKTETRTSITFQKIITVNVSPEESVFPRFFKVTDVTLTENKKVTNYISKVHNCQCITSVKCVALII